MLVFYEMIAPQPPKSVQPVAPIQPQPTQPIQNVTPQQPVQTTQPVQQPEQPDRLSRLAKNVALVGGGIAVGALAHKIFGGDHNEGNNVSPSTATVGLSNTQHSTPSPPLKTSELTQNEVVQPQSREPTKPTIPKQPSQQKIEPDPGYRRAQAIQLRPGNRSTIEFTDKPINNVYSNRQMRLAKPMSSF